MALTLHKHNHIEAWQVSGLSQRTYCQRYGLNAKTFGNWLRIYRAERINAEVPMLIPVKVKSTASSMESLYLRGSKGHTLQLPANVSPQWLGELLKCLD
ncbi:IS66 family insertion sequence element accessory protein TnpB [Nitrosomonas communis]|uniref:IS66 family insertion sequence element accessory protein TnpA n=1 Tax=Nitrosomonas communis TaxID=44574 RepID=UPI0026F1ADE5|nr:IS66 family insertion sequence element accessory protein TnpB [Nitrosomonas communis]MCO6427549.1 IS66 family insertion sequence element accessory protein TnpB [Nitrosomonas communis]